MVNDQRNDSNQIASALRWLLETGEPGAEAQIRQIVQASRALVPGCDRASVTLMRNGVAATVAASDQSVIRCDEAQYRTGSGPCLKAVEEGRPIVLRDTATDQRFEEFDSVAMSHSFESVLSFPLIVDRQIVGSLNLYFNHSTAYDQSSLHAASLVAEGAQEVLSRPDDIELLMKLSDQYVIDLRDTVDAHEPVSVQVNKIVLIDDAVEMRMLLRSLLESHGGFEVAGEAANGYEGLKLVETVQPDVVVLDLEMPLMDGWDALPRIKQTSPTTNVVIFSSFSEADVTRLKGLGACGLVRKGNGATALLEIRQAIDSCSDPCHVHD